MTKSPDAFRTISEVSEWLDTPAHVLRFWESRFSQIKPLKRAGGRRYYRPADMLLLGGIKQLLHEEGITIRGVQKILREKGIKHVLSYSPPLDGVDMSTQEEPAAAAAETDSGAGTPAAGSARAASASVTPLRPAGDGNDAGADAADPHWADVPPESAGAPAGAPRPPEGSDAADATATAPGHAPGAAESRGDASAQVRQSDWIEEAETRSDAAAGGREDMSGLSGEPTEEHEEGSEDGAERDDAPAAWQRPAEEPARATGFAEGAAPDFFDRAAPGDTSHLTEGEDATPTPVPPAASAPRDESDLAQDAAVTGYGQPEEPGATAADAGPSSTAGAEEPVGADPDDGDFTASHAPMPTRLSDLVALSDSPGEAVRSRMTELAQRLSALRDRVADRPPF